ncbi:DUF4340 domain-containing protein [Paraliobacillus ryukyuensis]|uniref:DUF4340 domain-containing protein n=1 Tax=Paraliobacillus ryukyuensis TaxID=200904 RepID=UPI0009A62DE5|nr:DUF4340 domain-containing protein [Paraliobacillus ryukyuensis]
MNKLIKASLVVLIGMTMVGFQFFLTNHTTLSHEVKAATVKLITNDHEIDEMRIQTSQSFTLKKEQQKWMTSDSEFAVDQEVITTALQAITALEGKHIDIEKKDVGLDFPKIMLKLNSLGKEVLELTIGDLTKDKTKYYVEDRTNQAIYLVDRSLMETFPYNLQSYLENAILSLAADRIEQININNGTETIELTAKPPFTEEETKASVTGWFIHAPYQGYYQTAYTKMSAILYGIDQLQMTALIEKNPTDLEKYGLADTDFTIAFKAGNKTETIKIGNPAAEGNYYAKLADKPSVFTINTELLNLFSYPAKQMHDGYIKMLALDTLNQLVVKTTDETFTVDISHRRNNEGEMTSKFVMNDNAINDKTFREAYQRVAGLKAAGLIKEPVKGEPKITIQYDVQVAGHQEKQVKIELFAYNDAHYAIYVDGVGDFVVRKDELDQMITALRALK